MVPVDRDTAFPVPADVDPALASALGVAGSVAWTAVDCRAHVEAGEAVLVLGAGGSAGQVALQAARLLGAGRIVGVARGEAAERARAHQPDAVVDMEDGDGLSEQLRSASPHGYDVVIDFLWGDVAEHALAAAKPGARHVQVGSSAGAAATVDGLTLHSKQATIIGHALTLTPLEVRRAAYARLMHHARQASIRLETERTNLSDITDTWKRLKEGAPGKVVVSL